MTTQPLKSTLTVSLVALFLLKCVHAHVVLTFPPARNPKYDYLDNYREGGPCGVPDDPNGRVTTLRAGSSFNLTYYLSFPHKGGIRANLLNSTGHVLYALLGLQEPFVNSEDITLEHHKIVLPPNFVCERCVLQVERQAIEINFIWADMVFRSCADIAIVDSPGAVCDNMTCSGHGTCENGKCNCDRLYSGDICQNKDECEDESDCSGHGSCVDLHASWYPSKQCFCNSGWYGDNCAQSSSLTSASINPSEYTIRRELHPQLMLYARIDGSELEVALKLNGTSYVGLGWKPMEGLDNTCNSEIPEVTIPGSHPLWQYPLSFPMVQGADIFYNQLSGINSTYVPPSDVRGKGRSSGLHPMDCTDIVVGMARGSQFRVFDYFTRDRGQPWRDDFYKGEESLTAAVGKEENGFTYIKWRRPLVTGDTAADYNIENKGITLIWAFGQVYPQYHHRLLSDAEFNITQNQRFFPVDQLKYHGGKNRGGTIINFFEADNELRESAATKTVTAASLYLTLLLSILIAAHQIISD